VLAVDEHFGDADARRRPAPFRTTTMTRQPFATLSDTDLPDEQITPFHLVEFIEKHVGRGTILVVTTIDEKGREFKGFVTKVEVTPVAAADILLNLISDQRVGIPRSTP
jgi:hypothetical protein